MATIKPAVKLASITRNSGVDPSTRNPSMGLDWALGPAVASVPDGDFQNRRMPRGSATQGAAPAITMPPASFSVNTTVGKPRKSARGNQYR